MQTVFQDSPLGDYLEQVDGIGGLESNSSLIYPKPLILNDPSQMQRRRFRALVQNALRSTLSAQETDKFLEQFRYALISSQLLEDSPRAMNSNRSRQSNINMKSQHGRRNDVLFGDGPWTALKMRSRLWTGRGGSCILLIISVLSLHKKSLTRKNAIIFIAGVCIILFLFAHSRRRALRILRAKAITCANIFIDSSTSFDKSLSTCLGLIHQIELLARGYRPDLADRNDTSSSFNSIPAGRIELSRKHNRTAKHIRSAVCASLYLVIETFEDSIMRLLPYCKYLDLCTYFDIYDLKQSHDELGLLISKARDSNYSIWNCPSINGDSFHGAAAANATLDRLRLEMRRAHTLRRTFICCLLVINTSGECSDSEFQKWHTVVDELDQIAGLMDRMASTLRRDNLLYKQPDLQADNDDNTISNELALLLSTMAHLESRLQLLRENIDYEHNYQLLGEDINSLQHVWEKGKSKDTDMSLNSSGTTLATAPGTPDLSVYEHRSMLSTSSTAVDDCYDEGLISPREALEAGYRKGYVYEATTTSGPEKSKPLPREERIRIMNIAREKEIERKKNLMDHENFMNELGGVLQKRG